jgi:hypothetical protein
VTLSATGAVAVVGTLSQTLGAVTVSAAGAVPVVGSLSATLDALTVNAAGLVGAAIGTLDVTLGAITLSASGVVTEGEVIPPATSGGGAGAVSEPPHRRAQRERARQRVIAPRYRVLAHEEIYGRQEPIQEALRRSTAPAALLPGAPETALPQFDAASLQALGAAEDQRQALVEAIQTAAIAAAQEKDRRDREQAKIAAEVARIQAEAAEIAASNAAAIAVIMQAEAATSSGFPRDDQFASPGVTGTGSGGPQSPASRPARRTGPSSPVEA